MKKIKELYKKYEEIINYVIVGGLTTVVSLVTYYACVFTFLNPKDALQLQIANIISWIFAVLFAYFANRKYVFKSKSQNKLNEFLKFTLARVSTLLIDMFSMFCLVTLLGLNDKISKLFVQVIVIILNYVFSKIFVFNKN